MALSVTSDDLAALLGDVDEDRADFVLDLVMSEAATIVDPVPDGAKAAVLMAAIRIYSNPTGVTQELIGPYQFSKPAANLLTKAERASIRRAGGGGGAFQIDQLGINGALDDTDYPDVRFPTS